MKQITLTLLAAVIFLSGCDSSSNANSSGSVNPDDDVVYELTFTSNWNDQEFPTNFPSNAHFSGLIGLTHNDQVRIFQRSELASQGIIQMAETGSKSQLSTEINTLINNGNSDKILDGPGIPAGSSVATLTFSANTTFSHLSITSMVAPSPDWFIGIDSLDLYENNEWKDNITINLKVYDAGSDGGTRFTSGNLPLNNQEVITLLTSDSDDTDFLAGVERNNGLYIGTITLKIKP